MRAENPDDDTDTEYWRLYNTLADKIDGKYQELDYFKAGDRVLHIYGSKYTVIIPKPSDTMAQCAVCGITTDINKGYCHKCGYTLPSFFSKE